MKLYIASGFDNGPNVKRLADALIQFGVEITVPWWDIPLAKEQDPVARPKIAAMDAKGVMDADMLLMWLPGNPPTYHSRGWGTHVEMGIALALGVPIVIASPTEDPGAFCVFHYDTDVYERRVVHDTQDLFNFVLEYSELFKRRAGPWSGRG